MAENEVEQWLEQVSSLDIKYRLRETIDLGGEVNVNKSPIQLAPDLRNIW